MARTLSAGGIASQTASSVRFGLATREDDAQLRALLRDTPMGGRIRLALTREPSFFADERLWETKQTIVARAAGQIVCVGTCAIRRAFVNGGCCRVGYLGGLRLAGAAAGRFDIIRRGYQYFRALCREAAPDFLFTSIAEDNQPARRFLERDLPGLPRYQHVADFVTLVFEVPNRIERPPGSSQICDANDSKLEKLTECLWPENQSFQFAPAWTLAELRSAAALGLTTADFHTRHLNGKLLWCAALWDQRDFAQTVVANYSPWLRRARPVLNWLTPFANRPPLPKPGAAIARATISHVALMERSPSTLLELTTDLLAAARLRGIRFVTLGLHGADPGLAVVRSRIRGYEYRSRIYVVSWPETPGQAADLDARPVRPELSIL